MTKEIWQVLKDNEDKLLNIVGVVGVGESEYKGKGCIMVMVIAKTPQLEGKIPDELDGYKVVIEETGSFDALSM